MLSELQVGFERVERRRRELLSGLEGVGDDTLNATPPIGGWSVIQVMAHLILSESRTLTYLERKLQAPPEALPVAGVSAALRAYALTLALRSPLRAQAPEAVRDVPEREAFAETRRRWDETRAGWGRFLEAFPGGLRRKAVFRHPRAGRIDIVQTVTFLDEHLAHHARQIGRIRAALG